MFINRNVLALTLILVIGFLAVFAVTAKAGSDPSMTLYAGEISSSQYGFGNTTSTLASNPGPTLYLQQGTSYTMTVDNIGSMPHAWEIVSSKAASSSPMFGAGIDISSYISPGNSASITFTPNQAGNFYYVCPVPGHITFGMWGNVVVSSTTPEFPSVLTIMFMAIALTTLAAFLGRQKIRTKAQVPF